MEDNYLYLVAIYCLLSMDQALYWVIHAHTYHLQSSWQPSEVCITIPILQRKKPRLRKSQWLPEDTQPEHGGAATGTQGFWLLVPRSLHHIPVSHPHNKYRRVTLPQATDSSIWSVPDPTPGALHILTYLILSTMSGFGNNCNPHFRDEEWRLREAQ